MCKRNQINESFAGISVFKGLLHLLRRLFLVQQESGLDSDANNSILNFGRNKLNMPLVKSEVDNTLRANEWPQPLKFFLPVIFTKLHWKSEFLTCRTNAIASGSRTRRCKCSYLPRARVSRINSAYVLQLFRRRLSSLLVQGFTLTRHASSLAQLQR